MRCMYKVIFIQMYKYTYHLFDIKQKTGFFVVVFLKQKTDIKKKQWQNWILMY